MQKACLKVDKSIVKHYILGYLTKSADSLGDKEGGWNIILCTHKHSLHTVQNITASMK